MTWGINTPVDAAANPHDTYTKHSEKQYFQALGGIRVDVGHYDAICHTSKRPKVKCLQELQKQSQLNPAQECSSAFSSELAYMLSVLLS